MNFENVVKNVFVIHLEHRHDRLFYIQEEILKITENYSLFSACNGHELKTSYNLLPGELGIQQTHIKLLNLAKNLELESVLILEDDVAFSESIQQLLIDSLKNVPDNCDLLYLGGTHKQPIQTIKENIFRVYNTVTLHAVWIHSRVYKKIINCIENNPDKPVDDAYAILQPKLNAYCVYPPLAWQKDDYSDIQNKFVQYDWLKPQ